MAPLRASEPVALKIEEFQTHYRFQKFMSFIGMKLQAFQKEYAPKAQSVFYPFGGPDILHPLLLFPDAKVYVLVGLEDLGAELSDKILDSVFTKLGSLLRRGFFVTSTMTHTFNHISGVRAALALQIRLIGGKILEDFLLDPGSLSISFEWQGQTKTLYYLKQNLANDLDGLFEFLKRHGVSEVCLLKSSSYSLHKKLFSHLKEKILKHFSILVQDDTGIPVKDLTDFDIQLFGRYIAPYGVEFAAFQQNDLKEEYASKGDIPPLNFCFGYGCGRVQANLMIAWRKHQ
jgi:hypothetical protein